MIATPEQARAAWLCPLARVFADLTSHCRGDECPLWRWKPITTSDPRWLDAMKLAMAETGDRGAGKKAAKMVLEDPERFGLPAHPDTGWCGLGGKPEWEAA